MQQLTRAIQYAHDQRYACFNLKERGKESRPYLGKREGDTPLTPSTCTPSTYLHTKHVDIHAGWWCPQLSSPLAKADVFGMMQA